MKFMGYTGVLLTTLNPIDRGIWQGQNLLRRSGETAELWVKDILQLLQRQTLGSGEMPPWLEVFAIWLVRAIAVAFGFFVLYVLLKFIRAWFQGRQQATSDSPISRQHPIEQPLSAQDWLLRSQQAQAQQDYALACRALYMALLVRLDEADWLARNPAWTDQDYLRRLDALWVMAPRPVDLSPLWRRLFLTHEQSVYGKLPVSAERFQGCQQAYQTLDPEFDKGPLSTQETR